MRLASQKPLQVEILGEGSPDRGKVQFTGQAHAANEYPAGGAGFSLRRFAVMLIVLIFRRLPLSLRERDTEQPNTRRSTQGGEASVEQARHVPIALRQCAGLRRAPA